MISIHTFQENLRTGAITRTRNSLPPTGGGFLGSILNICESNKLFKSKLINKTKILITLLRVLHETHVEHILSNFRDLFDFNHFWISREYTVYTNYLSVWLSMYKKDFVVSDTLVSKNIYVKILMWIETSNFQFS